LFLFFAVNPIFSGWHGIEAFRNNVMSNGLVMSGAPQRGRSIAW
jgi:hypothetical protein